jgi:methionyl-tRNA formyltransferase
MGTPDFAVPSLHKLYQSNHQVLSVVTVPDKPKGRGLKLIPSPVKQFCIDNNIDFLQPEKLKDLEFLNIIKVLQPDLIVVVAFKILPPELFNIPKYGSVNLHASLLPKYRGAAPINWAIINGEKKTGVTTFFLKEKVDTGNIILQEECDINDGDDAGTMHYMLSLLGSEVILKTVNIIEKKNGFLKVTYQDDKDASPAPKLLVENCRINWNNTSKDTFNFIRGLSPLPGAFTFFNNSRIKIYKSQIAELHSVNEIKPGLCLNKEDKLFICCNDGYLEILEVQIEGKRKMSASEYLRGSRILTGDILS